MHALAIEELERQLEEKEKEVEDLLQVRFPCSFCG